MGGGLPHWHICRRNQIHLLQYLLTQNPSTCLNPHHLTRVFIDDAGCAGASGLGQELQRSHWGFGPNRNSSAVIHGGCENTLLLSAYIPGSRGDTRGASIQPDAAPDVQPRLRGCEGPHEQPRGAGADVLTRVQLHRRASVSACNQRSPPATTHPQTPHRSSLSRAAAIHRLLLQGACAFSLFPRARAAFYRV